jgi:aldose 1-epimerase
MRLANDHAVALVDLDGGRLASLAVHGLELLVPRAEKATRWGSFPMIPWCGRLPFGHLAFGGHDYDVPRNSPPHANHGRTMLQTWTEAGPGTIRTELVEPWPFGGHAVQRFELGDDHLTVSAEVHAGDERMPAMAGWHPWFRRQLDAGRPAELAFAARAVYETDADDVPTGRLVAVPPPPWNACFVGVTDGPTIAWPGALTLSITSTFDHWVIFTEPGHALCVEPQSGPPNEFHLDPQVIGPGESLVGSMTLRWSAA